MPTGYISQGSLMCLGQSAGIIPADFILAQSHTELRHTDLQISDYLNIHGMIFRPATYNKLLQYTFKKNNVCLRQHLKTFRSVWGLPDKTKNEFWHKPDYCNVVSGFNQKYIALSSGRFGRWHQLASYLSTCLGNYCMAWPTLDLEKPVQSKQQAFNYV